MMRLLVPRRWAPLRLGRTPLAEGIDLGLGQHGLDLAVNLGALSVAVPTLTPRRPALSALPPAWRTGGSAGLLSDQDLADALGLGVGEIDRLV